MLTAILCTVLIVLIYLKLFQLHNHWRNKGVKQLNSPYLFGDLVRVIFKKESIYDVFIKLYNSFPNERYVGMYQTVFPVFIVKNIKLIKQICVKDFEYFTDHRRFVADNADPFWSRNLFALKGNQWRNMRITLSPSFTSSKMRILFTLMSECAEEHLQYFLKSNNSITIELKDVFTRYANDIIATVAFGLKCDSMNHKTNEFFLMGRKATTFSFWKNITLFITAAIPIISVIFDVQFFPKSVSHFFKKLIEDTLRVRKEQGMVRPDMLQLLLESRIKGNVEVEQSKEDVGFAVAKEVLNEKIMKKITITDNDIVSQALIFFFAGFDTTSTLMTFMGYELAVNPGIQKKLQEEIDATVKACNGKLTYEVLIKMSYMDMVITETLRKWPPVVAFDRSCTKSYTIKPENPEEKPVTLEPEDVVWIPVCAIHHNPKYYPNPQKFDPERFSEDNKSKINPYTFLPFGLGPRSCIGSRLALLEAKTIFYYILQRFDFVATEKTDIPVKFKTAFTILSADDIWVDLKPRVL